MELDRWIGAIAGLGVLVLTATLVHVGLHVDHKSPLPLVIEHFAGVAPALAVLYGSDRIRRRGYLVARTARVFAWAVAGTVVISVLAVGILYIGSSRGVAGHELVSAITVSTAWGAAVGLLVGVLEARSIEVTHGAERARSQAREEQQQRATVEHLNALLRHNVLNAANVIEGTTDDLLQDADGERRDRLRTIRSRSVEMVDLAENVRTMLRAAADNREERVVDLAGMVEDAAASVRERHPAATLTVDTPESATVHGDQFFEDALECLLSSAVRYGDDTAAVTVHLTRESGEVGLRVDTDARLPARVRTEPFERSDEGDDDVRLLLVGSVVEPYGTTTVVEPDGSGTTFLLTFAPADGTTSATAPARASPAR
jgi:hypothetical protein